MARPRVDIVEVAPRDGLQADPADLATAAKIELIERLVSCGHHRIEAASFVSPTAVPKLADGAAVLAGVPRGKGVRYSALALNTRGVEAAVAAGVDEVNGVVCATDTFAMRNQNADVAGCVQRWVDSAEVARRAGVATSITLSAAWGCPYEGEVPLDRVVALAETLLATDPDELVLADTIGVAVPTEVARRLAAVEALGGRARLRVHFHDTRNTAVANVVAAFDAGVSVFDASLGGLGGCPFAPRATGNVATEDLVYLFDRMGVDTGLDLDALIAAAAWLETAVGHAVPSRVSKAGGFPA